MTIYTVKQMMEKIATMTDEDMRTALTRMVQLHVSSSTRQQFATVIFGERELPPTVFLSDDRPVLRHTLENLASSPMVNYIPEIIQAALDPRGPFQSREILMLADQLKGGKAFYITANGIPQNFKNDAGLVLSMAGFERVSHYDRERKMPVKAWKVKKAWQHFTPEQRVDMVYDTLRHEGGAQRPAPVSNILGSFI